jgi:hypothetical protein
MIRAWYFYLDKEARRQWTRPDSEWINSHDMQYCLFNDIGEGM